MKLPELLKETAKVKYIVKLGDDLYYKQRIGSNGEVTDPSREHARHFMHNATRFASKRKADEVASKIKGEVVPFESGSRPIGT